MKELKCFRRDEKMRVQNRHDRCSDRPVPMVLPAAITLKPFIPSTVQPVNHFNSSLITGHQSVEPSLSSCSSRDQFRLLTPEFSGKYFFPKNEAKLCPSLLTIVKKTNPKRTQTEAKRTPINPKKHPL
jgi:hypothetical protein